MAFELMLQNIQKAEISWRQDRRCRSDLYRRLHSPIAAGVPRSSAWQRKTHNKSMSLEAVKDIVHSKGS